MRGEIVIVRAYGSEPLKRRVWDADSDGVYICTDENFERLISGEEALNPVGFPREDVFNYDESVVGDLVKQYKKNPALWKRLTIWKGDVNGNGEAYSS